MNNMEENFQKHYTVIFLVAGLELQTVSLGWDFLLWGWPLVASLMTNSMYPALHMCKEHHSHHWKCWVLKTTWQVGRGKHSYN